MPRDCPIGGMVWGKQWVRVDLVNNNLRFFLRFISYNFALPVCSIANPLVTASARHGVICCTGRDWWFWTHGPNPGFQQWRQWGPVAVRNRITTRPITGGTGGMASRRGKSGSFLGVMETTAVARDQMNFDHSGLVHSPRLPTTAQD